MGRRMWIPGIALGWTLLMAGLAPSLSAGEVALKPPVPKGEHPRLLFTRAELPAIRQRAATPPGKALLDPAPFEVHWTSYFDGLTKRDAKWLEAKTKESLCGYSEFSAQCRQAALAYQITGDAQAGKVAADAFRLWLSAKPLEQTKPTEEWGVFDYAMAYDWVYELLTRDEREQARQILAAMVTPQKLESFSRWPWMEGPAPGGRNMGNFTANCCASMILTNLAIEGEKGFNPEVLARSIMLLRRWLNEGISADGAMYEGMGYATGFGTLFLPHALIALRLRGADLYRESHVDQVPSWLAQEILPWGYSSFDHNQAHWAALGAGSFLTFLAREYGGLARWAYDNGCMPALGRLPDRTIGLINGLPEGDGGVPDRLPLCQWFSARGSVFSRSGWGERDALFMFNCNPFGVGHSHADQGHFCLAANGAYLLTDSSVMRFDSQEHNLVHIDGLAQAAVQGRLDGYIRSVDSTAYADCTDADLKLAYDRVFSDAGTWHWQEYNPVEKAERRTVFARGVTGPVVVIADDIRKDGQVRTYDWLVHTVPDNVMAVEGRRFTIRERFGGKFFRSVTSGNRAVLSAKGVPAGTYRGWALVRGEPVPTGWSSNTLIVNGKKAPYDTTFFGRGDYERGWRWLAILPDGKTDTPVADGVGITLELICNRGGRVAQAVFTKDQAWQPGDAEIPKTGGDFVLLDVNSTQADDAAKSWDIAEAPKATLDGVFLGATAPVLRMDRSRATNYRVLHAEQRRAGTRFLAVMAPHDEGDGRTLEMLKDGGDQVAVIRSAAGMDVVGGVVDQGPVTGELATDGQVALVSFRKTETRDQMRGYCLVAGRQLGWQGSSLVQAQGGVVHVNNDGAVLVVRGPGGSSVQCRRLGAIRVLCNGAELPLARSDVVTVTIPVLPKAWSVVVSPDGREVRVTGDGPLPLKIDNAPDAVNLVVNGINRHFVRDNQTGGRRGPIYAALQNGVELYTYSHQVEADGLLKLLVPGTKADVVDAAVYDPALPNLKVLKAAGDTLELEFATSGPAAYRLVFDCISARPGPLTVLVDGTALPQAVAMNKPNCLQTVAFDDVKVLSAKARLSLRHEGGIGLVSFRPQPVPRPLAATGWMTIGPFPTGYTKEAGLKIETLKAAFDSRFPPETELNFAAEYRGTGDKPIRWQHTDTADTPLLKNGLDFRLCTGIPTLSLNLCFGVTHITSPDERPAELSVACDFWANLYLNGELVRSERPARESAVDGAQFTGYSPLRAPVTLRKGVNTLLVKNHGGTGPSWISVWLTDPGDLNVSPTPPGNP